MNMIIHVMMIIMMMMMMMMTFQNREPVCEPVHAHVPVLLE